MKVKFIIPFLLGVCGVVYAAMPDRQQQINNPVAEISGDTWFNSAPLKSADLRGKVVLVEFWTFDCYNCKNVEPYVKQWYQRFKDQGFEIVAVHTPEFAHERVAGNVEQYMKENKITYPVVMDNDFVIWKRFSNRYWPAFYLVDKQGMIRYKRIGEGGYAETAQWIQKLLKE